LINIAVHIIWYQLGLSSACSIYYRLPTTTLSPARC